MVATMINNDSFERWEDMGWIGIIANVIIFYVKKKYNNMSLSHIKIGFLNRFLLICQLVLHSSFYHCGEFILAIDAKQHLKFYVRYYGRYKLSILTLFSPG